MCHFVLSDISKQNLFSSQVNVNMTVQVSEVIMSVMRMIVITFKPDNKFSRSNNRVFVYI